METLPRYNLRFICQENHLMLPRLSSIVLTQNLYNVLFQYVGSPEKEELLKVFIKKLEQHIKSKSNTPFSLPVNELDFLEEGLQELKLLNWLEIPVMVVELEIEETMADPEEKIDFIVQQLEKYMTCAYHPEKKLIYIYPANLVR